jgi:predicted nucleic acid-binding protein
VASARIFVDTGAWFALMAVDDRHHREAELALPDIRTRFRTLVTTNHVVAETYTLLRTRKSYRVARRFLDILDESPRLERHFVKPDLEAETVRLLDRYAEHPLSFVDGTSFVVMRRESIQDAFAFDHHFTIAGFTIVPAR